MSTKFWKAEGWLLYQPPFSRSWHTCQKSLLRSAPLIRGTNQQPGPCSCGLAVNSLSSAEPELL